MSPRDWPAWVMLTRYLLVIGLPSLSRLSNGDMEAGVFQNCPAWIALWLKSMRTFGAHSTLGRSRGPALIFFIKGGTYMEKKVGGGGDLLDPLDLPLLRGGEGGGVQGGYIIKLL